MAKFLLSMQLSLLISVTLDKKNDSYFSSFLWIHTKTDHP